MPPGALLPAAMLAARDSTAAAAAAFLWRAAAFLFSWSSFSLFVKRWIGKGLTRWVACKGVDVGCVEHEMVGELL